jgi:Reverse transcriptase (RNA-dependent DNA polymerase)
MSLECAVEETDDRGRKTRTTEAKDQRRGIPQGSPISPLLANLYMRRFVLGWKKLGLETSLGSRIVTYADDLVILCRKGRAEEALSRMREIMGKLKLTVNERCRLPLREVSFTEAPPARRAATVGECVERQLLVSLYRCPARARCKARFLDWVCVLCPDSIADLAATVEWLRKDLPQCPRNHS